MAITVTATQGGSTANGMAIRVFVLTGAAKAAAQTGAATNNQFSGTGTWTQSITTTAGSNVYGASMPTVSGIPATGSNATVVDNISDATNNESYITFHALNVTGGATVRGFTTNTASGPFAMLEILASGTLAEDASGNGVVNNTTGAGPVTTPSFTPPGGSLLVACVMSDGGVGAVTFSLSNSGTALNWAEKSVNHPNGGDYAGVWIADVPAAGAPLVKQTRLRMFRQALLGRVATVTGIPGQQQPQPTFPLPRRIPARAVWHGGSGTVGVQGTVQPQPTFPLPRRRLSRGFWGGLAGTVGIRGTVQPRPTVTQPRRNPYARVVWHGGQGGIAPGGTIQPWPTIPVPRRRPARAVIQFTPVTTINQVPPAAPSGTVQPQPTVTPSRLHPSRAYVRFTPVTTINAGIPGQPQPWPTIKIPRRKPGRAFIEFTPVTTTNQVVAGISGTVQPRATLTWARRKPVRAYTAVTYHPVRTVNAPAAAFVPALSPTGAGGSIEGELWRMARDGDWPKRPPGFGPVGQVPTVSTRPEEPTGRGWVGKKVRRFFWPRDDD